MEILLPEQGFFNFAQISRRASQSGEFIIFLYPLGSSGARGRKSANFVYSVKLTPIITIVWIGKDTCILTGNCVVSFPFG
jgi:hypothetical protein